jgi:hypothetical protein
MKIFLTVILVITAIYVVGRIVEPQRLNKVRKEKQKKIDDVKLASYKIKILERMDEVFALKKTTEHADKVNKRLERRYLKHPTIVGAVLVVISIGIRNIEYVLTLWRELFMLELKSNLIDCKMYGGSRTLAEWKARIKVLVIGITNMFFGLAGFITFMPIYICIEMAHMIKIKKERKEED